jgi:hypothetical protein
VNAVLGSSTLHTEYHQQGQQQTSCVKHLSTKRKDELGDSTNNFGEHSLLFILAACIKDGQQSHYDNCQHRTNYWKILPLNLQDYFKYIGTFLSDKGTYFPIFN